MNALMLDAHHDDPQGAVLSDRQGDVTGSYEMVHHLASLLTMRFDLCRRGPVMMSIIQVIPRHFVHTYRQHGFQGRVDALIDEPGDVELVDEKY
jgi:hypothetical protein